MAHVTYIYGMIRGASWKTEDYYKLQRENQAVIKSIPEQDTDEWPWINRSMFSIPNDQGRFRDQIITIGGSYRSLEYGWSKWLEKFEKIISQMYWYYVVIRVDFEYTKEYTYEWYVDHAMMSEY